MRYGTIVKYFTDKQFGFIRPDTGKDVFFHSSVIEAAEAQPEINVGQAVKFESMPREQQTRDADDSPGDKRTPPQLRAKTVVFIDKIPGSSLADSEPNQPSNRHRKARKKKPTWRR